VAEDEIVVVRLLRDWRSRKAGEELVVPKEWVSDMECEILEVLGRWRIPSFMKMEYPEKCWECRYFNARWNRCSYWMERVEFVEGCDYYRHYPKDDC